MYIGREAEIKLNEINRVTADVREILNLLFL